MSQVQVDARTQADFYRERAEIFRSRSGSFLKSVRARRNSVALAAYYEKAGSLERDREHFSEYSPRGT